MRVKQRYDYVINYFSKAMPTAESELNFSNAFELLVAVVLSRINQSDAVYICAQERCAG